MRKTTVCASLRVATATPRTGLRTRPGGLAGLTIPHPSATGSTPGHRTGTPVIHACQSRQIIQDVAEEQHIVNRSTRQVSPPIAVRVLGNAQKPVSDPGLPML
jgi:hypothetical protein